MRQPLEDGNVTILRVGGISDVSVAIHAGGGDESLPLRLFRRSDAGMPLHAADDSALRVKDFGSLLDRIDIHIEMPSVKYSELRGPASKEDSAASACG